MPEPGDCQQEEEVKEQGVAGVFLQSCSRREEEEEEIAGQADKTEKGQSSSLLVAEPVQDGNREGQEGEEEKVKQQALPGSCDQREDSGRERGTSSMTMAVDTGSDTTTQQATGTTTHQPQPGSNRQPRDNGPRCGIYP